MPDPIEPLIDVRESETFRTDQRDIEAALIYARPFATTEPIKDRQEAGQVADAIRGLNGAVKQASEHRLEASAPYRATTAAINGEYDEITQNTAAAEAALKKRALDFKRSEDKRIADEQRAEQQRIDAEAEAKAADAQAAAELAEAEPENPEAQQLAGEAHRDAAAAAVVTPPRPVAAPKQLRGDFSSIATRTEYRHEVFDAALLPAAYLAVNEKAVKAAIKGEKAMAKAQGRDFNLQLIPGVRIWPDEIGISRGRR